MSVPCVKASQSISQRTLLILLLLVSNVWTNLPQRPYKDPLRSTTGGHSHIPALVFLNDAHPPHRSSSESWLSRFSSGCRMASHSIPHSQLQPTRLGHSQLLMRRHPRIGQARDGSSPSLGSIVFTGMRRDMEDLLGLP